MPIAQSVSRISPTSAGLARAKRLASSGAVTGSFTVARAVLTALTRSDSVFGQASFPARCFPGFASGSTSTASAVCCGLGAARVLVIGPQPAHQARRLLLRPLGVQRHQAAPGFPRPSASAASHRPRKPPRPNHREAAGAPTPGPHHESASPSRSAPHWRAASPGRYTSPSASGRDSATARASGARPIPRQSCECAPVPLRRTRGKGRGRNK